MTNETKQSIKFKIRDTVGQVNTTLFISTEFVYDYTIFITYINYCEELKHTQKSRCYQN